MRLVKRTKRVLALSFAVFVLALIFLLLAYVGIPFLWWRKHNIHWMGGQKRMAVREVVEIRDSAESRRWEETFAAKDEQRTYPFVFSLRSGGQEYDVQISGLEIVVQGKGPSNAKHSYFGGFSAPQWPQVCDMDGDGNDDIVVFDPGDLFAVILYSDHDGRIRGSQFFHCSRGGGMVSDVDRDGTPDLVLRTRDASDSQWVYQVWYLERKHRK
jgi:hypothetical protein